ncbi:unnamed protein product [Porites evermanni]|uniref:Beta-glucuronidase n=1 Tax=Porites evermanni TaxID=104178 RepID=A0ABN8SP56_9CNID|nr:unnamed protein product [Porites evermanni]
MASFYKKCFLGFYVVLSLNVIVIMASLPGMLFPKDSERREVKDLSGLWDFRADMSDNRNGGFEKMWFAKPLWQSGEVIPMPVPSSFNDITEDRSLRDFVGWVWYEKEVYVPRSWENNTTRVVLRFEATNYHTIVWVNSKQVMTHSGGHLPFEVDVTPLLTYDKPNRITAAINNTLTPTTLPPGEIKYLTGGDWYPPGFFIQKYYFDFFNYAGIHRPVKLYTTPVIFLSDITVTTSFSNNTGEVKFVATVSSISSVSLLPKGDITVEYLLHDKQGFVVASAGGPDMFEGTLSIKNPMLWWPYGMSDDPAYLYTLKIITRSAMFVLEDVYYLPVGIRTVKVDETSFLINNKPFYFKGFGKHEDADIRGKGLDYALIAKDFSLLKWLGANSFRTSHYPYADEIMDMADKEGIVVIDECPGVGIKPNNLGKESLEHHVEVMAELIRRDKNRPAVVMWSVANEPCSDKPSSVPYFERLFQETRSLDPTRPVTFVTMFKAWSDKVVKFCDVILCNRYYAWYHDYGQTQLISKQLERELRGWFDAYGKPVIQAEYGADTVAGMHVEPAVMFSEEYQVESLLQYFPVFDKLKKEFFIGEMIWNFADFMTQQGTTRVVGNKKGILTRQRQPKAAAHLLRQRYLNITLEKGGSKTGDELLDTLLRFESRNPQNVAQTSMQQDYLAQPLV